MLLFKETKQFYIVRTVQQAELNFRFFLKANVYTCYLYGNKIMLY